ncbi:MAG: chromosome partitioning protein ParB [Mycobacteriales bacterium]
MALDTGFPVQDARDDFLRARRRAALSSVRRRLHGRNATYDVLLPFDEVVTALGRRGERDLGEQVIDVDSVVGSVDRSTGFDRLFRPTSDEMERRFQRIDVALRRGEEMPPIDVYRVGDVHFVIDGHHRVAVARALGWKTINAHVVEVLTSVGADRDLRLEDLPTKGHERVFAERVPLPPRMRDRIELHEADDYGELAEMVEAWGFRYIQLRGRMMDRQETAETWFTEEYEPGVDLLRQTGLLGGGTASTETEAYLRLSAERYRLLRSQSWDDATVERLRGTLERERRLS